VGYFNDPTTGPGSAGVYAGKVVQWAYPATGTDPVCPMPVIPSIPAPPPPLPERDDIKIVPLGDTLPVGFKMTDPANGRIYQKPCQPNAVRHCLLLGARGVGRSTDSAAPPVLTAAVASP